MKDSENKSLKKQIRYKLLEKEHEIEVNDGETGNNSENDGEME